MGFFDGGAEVPAAVAVGFSVALRLVMSPSRIIGYGARCVEYPGR